MMKEKLSKLERSWILYDVGNSAFVLLVSTIMPIYFKYLAGNADISSTDYLAYWGYAASVSTIIVAVLGPLLGAVCVGMFQGGIQALSRSYFAKIFSAEKSGEYFGILDICGKGASFIGTTLVSLITQITGHSEAGVSIISLIMIIGFIFFHFTVHQGTHYISPANQPPVSDTK